MTFFVYPAGRLSPRTAPVPYAACRLDYHFKTAAPHDSPAPNPDSMMVCPGFNLPSRFISSRRMGMLAEDVLPYSSRFMGNFSIYMMLLVGIKFIVKPVLTPKEVADEKTVRTKIIQSLLCGGLIGFICGFIGAGGGMMLLLILTSVLRYELKTAIGTSVFIMTFTALTGGVSNFIIGGMPDLVILFLCILFTLLGARLSAQFANRASEVVLIRTLGAILSILGLVMIGMSFFS